MIDEIKPNEELVFGIEWDYVESVFYKCGGTWDFGELTDTSKLTDLSYLLQFCEDFNGDVSHIDTSNATKLKQVFHVCRKFNNDSIKSWDVSNVVNMYNLFGISSSFNVDISGWDTSNVEDMSMMFYDAGSFNQDLSQWCVPKITSKQDAFDEDCDAWEESKKPVWGTCPRGENQ
jgi:surface protein